MGHERMLGQTALPDTQLPSGQTRESAPWGQTRGATQKAMLSLHERSEHITVPSGHVCCVSHSSKLDTQLPLGHRTCDSGQLVGVRHSAFEAAHWPFSHCTQPCGQVDCDGQPEASARQEPSAHWKGVGV